MASLMADYLRGAGEPMTLAKSWCRGKVAFDDPQVAMRAAARRKKRHAYRCPSCGRWHVGGGVGAANEKAKREASKDMKRKAADRHGWEMKNG